MGRMSGNKRRPNVKPVEKVEISEKHIGRRAIAAAVFLLIGAGSLAYFFVNLAEAMTAAGFTHGSISSDDGFVRNLDGRGLQCKKIKTLSAFSESVIIN